MVNIERMLQSVAGTAASELSQRYRSLHSRHEGGSLVRGAKRTYTPSISGCGEGRDRSIPNAERFQSCESRSMRNVISTTEFAVT